ncbi:MAG: glycosyltransferase family 2 protein [Mangrovibacterium sp.]
MNTSIIIVSYNTLNLICNCLDSVFEKTEGIDYEVIVVDNQSPDESVQVLKEKYGNVPNFRLIELKENIGFGRANNEGFKVAQGRNILLLNPDTILINNAIKILSDYLDANPKVGVCGGNLFDEEMKPAHSFRRMLPSIWTEINNLTFGMLFRVVYWRNREFNRSQKEMPVGYITGADMMIRKSVLDEVGHFNPAFFMYYEETELTYRIKKAGYQVMSVPSAEIQHLEGKSFGEFKERRERMILEGRAIYCGLTMGRAKQSLVNMVFRCNIRLRLLVHSLYQRGKKGYWMRKRELYMKLNRHGE